MSEGVYRIVETVTTVMYIAQKDSEKAEKLLSTMKTVVRRSTRTAS